MRYLIDGHNLIAQLPDIDLSDEHDEAQLVFKLRSFCTRTGDKATVIFDGGLPGGYSNTLSNSYVAVRFASAERSTADHILTALIRKVKDPKAYALVSSDREILNTALEHRMPILRTPEFIQKLNAQGLVQKGPGAEEKDPNVKLSPDEVEMWLEIFTRRYHDKKL
jgi:predicted RNA-binding protein with PIN domain